MPKNLILGLMLTHLGPNLVPKYFFVGFNSARCYTLLQAITVCNFKENYWAQLEKMSKNLVLGLILGPFAEIWT